MDGEGGEENKSPQPRVTSFIRQQEGKAPNFLAAWKDSD